MGHHHHGHSHETHGAGNRRRLAWTLVLAASYMFAEAAGGWLTGSLALLADAGHMLSAAAALGLSLFAMWIAQRPPNPRRTWGYYRTEILAALANGAALVAISIWVVLEAVQRFRNPPAVDAPVMMAIAAGGLVVALSVHLVVANEASNRSLLRSARASLHDRFGIHHATVQIEPEDCEEHRGHP